MADGWRHGESVQQAAESSAGVSESLRTATFCDSDSFGSENPSRVSQYRNERKLSVSAGVPGVIWAPLSLTVSQFPAAERNGMEAESEKLE